MDKLEKFIVDNKSKFDDPRSPEQGWDGLRNKLNTKNTNWGVYWKVAAVVFFASTILLSAMQMQQAPVELATVRPENNSIENYYAEQISLKKDEYRTLAPEDQRAELLKDLDGMDEAYIELTESFSELNDQEVVEAMLENLRLRILILNEQIEILRNGQGEEEYYHSS